MANGTERRDPGSYDRGHLVFLIFLYFGITALLPFNAFITPQGFYKAFYGYNPSFTNFISFCYNLPAVFMSIIMVIWGRKWPVVPRMMISLSLFLISLIFIPFIHVMFGIEDLTSKVDNGEKIEVENTTANDVITLLFMFLSGVSNGIFFPTVIQIATLHGDVYSQAMMEGNGIGGIIPAIINIITYLCVPDPQMMAAIYFIVAAIFVVFAFLMFFLLYKIPFSRSKIQKEAPLRCCSKYEQLLSSQEEEEGESSNMEERQLSMSMNERNENSYNLDDGEVELINHGEGHDESVDTNGISQGASSSLQMKPVDNAAYAAKFNKHSTKAIFRTLILPEISILSVFLVTLALFPATVLNMGFNEDLSMDWISIIVVGLFNLVDWIGRSLPKYKAINECKWLSEPKYLFIYTLARLAFIPLIVIPAAGVFTSTTYTIIVDIIFALTNGFLSSMSMMKGPFLADGDQERQVGGTLMTVMMNLGLTAGSTLNMAFVTLRSN